MLGLHLFRRLTSLRGNPRFHQQMILQMKSRSSFANQGSPFKFYSFEEEIHKLKAAQDSLKNKQSLIPGENPAEFHNDFFTNPMLKTAIDELNSIYREEKMFNFTVDPDYICTEIPSKYQNKHKESKNSNGFVDSKTEKESENSDNFNLNLTELASNSTNEALYIMKPLKIVIQAIVSDGLSNLEKAIVLEVFLHNILLSILCDSLQLHKKMQQNQARGPLIDEMRCLSRFLEKTVQSQEGMKIIKESVNLFKFTVKCFEVFRIKQRIAIPCIQKYLNIDDQSVANLYEISQLILPISDYIHEIGSLLNTVDNQKLDMSILSNKIRLILKSKQGKKNSRDEVNVLCKTLFCMVRINNGRGKVCLDLADSLLGSSYESLSEIEMTSIIYSISKLQYSRDEEILFERKIKREMPNLLFDYETKVEKLLSNKYFNYARVPFILYCLQNSSKYRPTHRRNSLGYLCRSLYSIVIKNYEKYKASEITTIIYSLKLLNPAFQTEIEQLYRAYFLKLALDKQKKDKSIIENNVQKYNQKLNNNKNAQELGSHDDEGSFEGNADNQSANVEQNDESLIQGASQSSSTLQELYQISQSDNSSQNSGLSPTNNPKQTIKNQGFNIKMQKVRNTIIYFEQLQAVDILCLFIGIRNNERQNSNGLRNSNTGYFSENTNNTSKADSLHVINQQLFSLFVSKQSEISNNLKIKILYEVAYNHSELLDSFIFEKYFSEWVVQVTDQLGSLNTHDFIALAFIMKKFARLFAYHIDYWIRFNDEATKRSFVHPVEISRVRLVIQNMHDFYYKCLNSPPSLNKQEKNRTKKLQIVFDQLCASQGRISQMNSSKDPEQSDEEFDFDRQY